MNKTLKKIWYEHCSRNMGFHDENFANELNDIQKQLDALEIIKKKTDINVVVIGDSPCFRVCNQKTFYVLTQNEFDLLKEVLKNE